MLMQHSGRKMRLVSFIFSIFSFSFEDLKKNLSRVKKIPFDPGVISHQVRFLGFNRQTF